MEKKIKILILDDEYKFCKSLEKYLAKAGYNAIFTTNGEHALDMIREEKPDIMTLDIRMPGINGYDVLEKAKKIDGKMRIIIVSAVDDPQIKLYKEYGAHALLQKPIALEDLKKIIERLVSEDSQNGEK